MIRILHATDWEPLLAFELRNRSWFEQHVEPRGDAFYSKAGVQSHIAEYLQAHAAGRWFPGLVLDRDHNIIGRTNLKDVDTQLGTAELGYRIAHDQVGKGVATETVIQIKALAQTLWNLKRLDAVVKPANLGSIQVLKKCGFVHLGPSQSEPPARNDKLPNIYQCTLGPSAI